MLPRLSDVPHSIQPSDESQTVSAIAEQLVQVGILTELPPGTSLTDAIEQSLSKFTGRYLTNSLCFDNLSAIITNDISQTTNMDWDKSCIAILCSEERFVYVLNKQIKKLEEKHPGAGRTVLQIIDNTLDHAISLFTPYRALETARYEYWHGEDDETEAIKELISEGEKPEDVNIFKLSMFEKSIPDWTYKTRPMPLATFRKIKHPIVTAALELHAQQIPRITYPPGLWRFGSLCATPVILQCKDYDCITQIFDDHINNGFQNDDPVHLCATIPFELMKGESLSLSHALKHLEKILRTMEAAEKLIHQISNLRN